MERIVASGLVVVNGGKLLVVNDGKDNFFKIPGGKVNSGENLEDCAVRELKEETGFDGKVLEKLSTMKLKKKPQTGEEIDIFLYHFHGEIKDKIKNFESFENNSHKVCWIDLNKLENYSVGPNIKFLIEKGELR